MAVDRHGNMYIADWQNHRIRKVSNGIITTVAGNGLAGYSGDGSAAMSAAFNNVYGVAVDSSGNLFIADHDNNRIRKVSNGTSKKTGPVRGDSASLRAPMVAP